MDDKLKTGGAAGSGLLLGVIIGAAIGLLLAPKSGEQTRRELKERLSEGADKAKDIVGRTSDQAGQNIKDFSDETLKELRELQASVGKINDRIQSLIK